MDFYFYAVKSFEHWDFMNPIIKGIGGSETSQIEMSSRLAQRHHNVVSYAPVAWNDEFKMHRNVIWKNFENATFKESGIWIIYRVPEALDNFNDNHPDQTIWFIAQDTFYLDLTEERAAKIDKYICLCSDHARFCEYKYPFLKGKISISSNGINVDLINTIASKQNIERNPHRLIYSSSPDRGLEQLIPIFKRAKEYIPDLELHVFYGFDNIDKIIVNMPWVAKMKESIMKGIDSTSGITWHGRVGQIDLLIEWLKSGIWCYPINFTETSCISCMEAQACGVVPIVSPVWALRENVMHGVFVEGDVSEKLTLAKFVGEIVKVARSESLREKLCENMIQDSKIRFNWERYVDQWESWLIDEDKRSPYPYVQYAFQHRYANGTILNIGCDSDASEFKKMRDAVNLDVEQNEKGTVDIICDILYDHTKINETSRVLKFDTVILGDMIEHMSYVQGKRAIENASKFLLNKDSKLIITCPFDDRPKEIQNPTLPPNSEYKGGISKYHRHVLQDELVTMIIDSGLKIDLMQEIDYTHHKGIGVIASLV